MPLAAHPDAPRLAWPEELIALLEEQHALMDDLTDLAERQRTLVQDRRTDTLLALLAQRQRIITRFTVLQRRLGAETEPLETRLREVSEPHRRRIRSLISEIGDQLARVMKRDEEDQARLEEARGETRDELAALDAARHARHAYLRHKSNDNRFADQQG